MLNHVTVIVAGDLEAVAQVQEHLERLDSRLSLRHGSAVPVQGVPVVVRWRVGDCAPVLSVNTSRQSVAQISAAVLAAGPPKRR